MREEAVLGCLNLLRVMLMDQTGNGRKSSKFNLHAWIVRGACVFLFYFICLRIAGSNTEREREKREEGSFSLWIAPPP